MKNMEISLDIIFIQNNGMISHIEKDVPPCEENPCTKYKTEKPVRYVLELISGFAEKYGVNVGGRIVF